MSIILRPLKETAVIKCRHSKANFGAKMYVSGWPRRRFVESDVLSMVLVDGTRFSFSPAAELTTTVCRSGFVQR